MLNLIRIIDPNAIKHIPRYLFEQIKDLEPEQIDAIYDYGSSIMTQVIQHNGQLVRVPNPLVWLVIMYDEKNLIKGFLWAEIDIIDRQIFVQALSVDHEYQERQELQNRIVEFLFNIPVPDDYKQKIQWCTTRPEAYERHGWERAESVLMEVTKEKYDARRKHENEDD